MLICIGVSVQLLVYPVPENEADNGEDDYNPEMITNFQLGGDTIGNVPPTFLLARDLILSQFSIDCCQNAFASGALPRTPLGGLKRPRPPAGKCGSHTLILQSADTENELPSPLSKSRAGPECKSCHSVLRNGRVGTY